ncbi:hypothetical protein [Corynebacterium mastitidis]
MSTSAALLAEVPPSPMIGTPRAVASGVDVLLMGSHRCLRLAPGLSPVEIGPPTMIEHGSIRQAATAPVAGVAARVWHGWAPHHWDYPISAIPLTHHEDTRYCDALHGLATQLAADHLIPDVLDTTSVVIDPIVMAHPHASGTQHDPDALEDYTHGLIRPVMDAAPCGLIGLVIHGEEPDPWLGMGLVGVGYHWADHQWAYQVCFMPLCHGVPRAWLTRRHTIDPDDELPLQLHLWPHFFVRAPQQIAVMLRRTHRIGARK